MPDERIDLKDIVEFPSRNVSVKLSRPAVTSRVATTAFTARGEFSAAIPLLSDKPLRRPRTRKLSK